MLKYTFLLESRSLVYSLNVKAVMCFQQGEGTCTHLLNDSLVTRLESSGFYSSANAVTQLVNVCDLQQLSPCNLYLDQDQL